MWVPRCPLMSIASTSCILRFLALAATENGKVSILPWPGTAEQIFMFAASRCFRKHSSGDLHSRLKTRKLLGVGETDDGDVHRSKVSSRSRFNAYVCISLSEDQNQLFSLFFFFFNFDTIPNSTLIQKESCQC